MAAPVEFNLEAFKPFIARLKHSPAGYGHAAFAREFS